MRTKTIARWRRAALAGTLAATLAVPVTARAQQDAKAAPPAQQAAAPDEQQAPAADQQPAPSADQQQAAPADQQQAPASADQQQAAPADQQQAPAADQQPAAQPAAPAGKPETAPVITEQSPRPPPDANIQPVPGTPDEYTIQKGDTLWDLSQKFLNNPWYWPKIWSLNPSIENPHWIYPGNKLRIVPGEGGAQAPAQVEAPPPEQPGLDAASASAAPEEPPSPPSDTNLTVPGGPDLEVVSRNGTGGSNTVSVSGKLAFTPPPVVTVRASGLIAPEEMSSVGTLDASFEEKEMLATYDTAYVHYKGEMPVKAGDKLVIFRPEGTIVDPVSHRKLADQTKTLGVARVISTDNGRATVQIDRTFEEIQRGDLVRPWEPQDKHVAPRPNTADVQGFIVRALNPQLTNFGEANEVFIDRGSADGVQDGNTFAVVRHGDGLSNTLVSDTSYVGGSGQAAASRVNTPDENVGLLLVVDTKEHLSTAIVVKSVRELVPGDLVEMRASGGAGGSP